MKFYTLGEVPVGAADQVFKVAPTGKAILSLIVLGMAIAGAVLGIYGWKPVGTPSWAYYGIAGVIGLFGLIPLGEFRASLRPSNWLVRCISGAILIKYRSYENWRMPADDVQAVALDYAEISWAKMVKERRETPVTGDRGGITIQVKYLTYIELGLVNSNTSDLEARLQAERNLRPEGMILTVDYPVRVLRGGTVQIRWSGGIRPSAGKAIEILGRQVNVVAAEHRKMDLTYNRHASPEEEQGKIVELAQSGDSIGAALLTRQVHGYSESQANEFVDKLTGDDRC
jgi:hypothetical protein